MEAEDVDLGAREFLQQRRDLLSVDPELLRAATHPHPRTLDLEVGVDPDRHLRAESRALPISNSRRASVADSISMVTPAAAAWDNSAGTLPGPAKLTRLGCTVVFKAVLSSRADATSKWSTNPLRGWTTAGIALASTA